MAQEHTIKFNFPVFIKECLLFVLTLALGVFVAMKYRAAYHFSQVAVEPVEFNLTDIIFLAVFFSAFTFIMLKYRRLAGKILRIFFLLVIFSGTNIVFETLAPFPQSLILSLMVVFGVLWGPNLLMHNFAVLLGIAGLSAVFGVSVEPLSVAILLGVLSVYDVIAVYKTKHMVVMAENMVVSHAVFGFLVPFKWRYFLTDVHSARIGQHIMILGSGDIGLPVVFVTSLLSVSVTAALMAGIGSVAGLFITHILFNNQTEQRPMAALPPIATMSIIGYLSYIIFFS